MKFKIIFLLILLTAIGLFNFLVFQEIRKPVGELEDKVFNPRKEVKEEIIPYFEPANLNWEQITSNAPWTERDAQTAVVFKDKIWVMGGILSGPGDYSQRVHKNDVWSSTNGKDWELITDKASWGPRRGHTSVVFDNKIWVMGGWEKSSKSYKNDVWYSEDGKNWVQAVSSAEWDSRIGHAAVVFDNKIWVMGGRDSQWQFKNDVWFSEDGKNWVEVNSQSAWSGRYDHTLIAFKDKIWLIGGVLCGAHGWEPGKNDVWSSTNGKDWELITDKAPWKGRHGHAVVVYKDKMWIVGGWDGICCGINDVWYSDDGLNWKKTLEDSPWEGREDHNVLVFKDKMWVVAGMITGRTRKNDVWSSVQSSIIEKEKGEEKKDYQEKEIISNPQEIILETP